MECFSPQSWKNGKTSCDVLKLIDFILEAVLGLQRS